MDAHDVIVPDKRWPDRGVGPIRDRSPAMRPPPPVWPSERRANWLVRIGITTAIAAAVATLAFGQHFPCEQIANVRRNTPEPPLAVAGVTVGDVTVAVAAQNRTWIETNVRPGQTLTLPVGEVQLDQALQIKDGCTIEGSGNTSIRNAHRSDRFGVNCSIFAIGNGASYVDGINVVGPNTVQLTTTTPAEQYQPGSVIYLAKYDGYTLPSGQLATRRMVLARSTNTAIVTTAGTTLTLDGPPIDKRVDFAKWFAAGRYIADAKQGGVSVMLLPGATNFNVGDPVVITDGPSLADEMRAEWRTVVSGGNVRIVLDRPLFRSYSNAIVARMEPVRGVTLRNLKIAQPVHPGSIPLFLKYCQNWRLENVECDGSAGGAGCSDFSATNCKFGRPEVDGFGLNSSQDCHLYGCTASSFVCEEGCFECSATDCTIGPSVQNGVQILAGCESITVQGCTIGGTKASALFANGRNHTIRDVRAQGGLGCYLVGSGHSIVNWDSEVDLALYGGPSLYARNVRVGFLYLGWTDGSVSSGTAIGCPRIKQLQGVWRVTP